MEISNDLKHTVITNDNIKEVHFAANGHHYLNPVEYQGKLYGNMLGGGVPDIASVITATATREEIIGTKKEEKKGK